jgi:hypothetical protein
MTEYHDYGVTLSEGQEKKIYNAHRKGTGVTIRLTKINLQGDHKLPLTQTQINKIKKAKNGVQLKLSETQLKHFEKWWKGGFIPLLSLIPIIASALGAAGGVAGGVASAVSAVKSNAEQARHNKAVEEQLKAGSGVVSDTVGKIPIVGTILGPLLQKLGLGIEDCNKVKNGGCVCCDGYKIKQRGKGLYLEPEGSGLFLGPRR